MASNQAKLRQGALKTPAKQGRLVPWGGPPATLRPRDRGGCVVKKEANHDCALEDYGAGLAHKISSSYSLFLTACWEM